MWFFRRKLKKNSAVDVFERTFGPFIALFGEDTLYLTLLHASGEKAEHACEAVQYVVESSDDAEKYIRTFLAEPNWRPHLVAAVAAMVSEDRSAYVPDLWQAFDSGSWVAPQLAVALSNCDAMFEQQAKERLEACCPVEPPDFGSMAERHHAAGPAGKVYRSAKNAASLFAMLSIRGVDADWVSKIRDLPQMQELLNKDIDDSSELAQRWANRIASAIAATGINLDHQAP